MIRSAWLVTRRLSLGAALILAASAVLLFSDRKRVETGPRAVPRVALLKYASRPLIDDLVGGLTRGLAERGYVAGDTMQLNVYDGQNDMSTVATIAGEMAGSGYDLLLTVSTPCLQAVARANQQTRRNHVFVGVTDPFTAGVGIRRENPLAHPPYLVGVGTFQPVEPLFRLVKTQLFPGLRRVGVVWNPAETCSEACTLTARRICRELGVELVELSVDKSSDVGEAAKALVARGVEALWLGGDNTVEMAADALVAAAAQGRIPVFCHNPDLVKHGVFAALGANYPEVGRKAGLLAADVLGGADPSRIPIENVVPERLALNLTRLKQLKADWKVSPAVRHRAALVVDDQGVHDNAPAAASPATRARPAKTWRLALVRYLDAPHTEEGTRGVLAGLREAGLEEGRDFTADVRSAQGDVATLNNILALVKNEHQDLGVSCFASIISAADRARLPMFSFVGKQARQGSVVALARDYYDAGLEAGLVAARVIRGESPSRIPLAVVKRARLSINLPKARKLGVPVPPALLERADEVIR